MEGANFRSPLINEPRIFGGTYSMNTPVGTIRTPQPALPPSLPPRPYIDLQQGSMYGGGHYVPEAMFGSSMYNNGFFSGNGGYNSQGHSAYSFNNGYVGMGYGGAYNRYGINNGIDPESRFIQIAEESSRPAFQSIESVVSAIANIAAMLDSTFFAITSSFRAILGVAANFGRLRSVFAQFWSTFAIFRGFSWLFKKILYLLKMSKIDPSTITFGEAFAAAEASHDKIPTLVHRGSSAWPVLVFISFIFTAPYLIMKLLGTVSQSALQQSKCPSTWVNAIKAQVKYDFHTSNPQELNLLSGQDIFIAPREIQNTQKLLNTGWVLATLDHQSSGIIPLNYIQAPQQQIFTNEIYQHENEPTIFNHKQLPNAYENNQENLQKKKSSEHPL